MKPYATYSAEELALDDLFVRWVKHPSDAEVVSFWNNWLVRHPECYQTVEDARQLILTFSAPLPEDQLAGEDISTLWRRIRVSLQEIDDVKTLQPNIQNVIAWWYFIRTVAALIGIVLFVGWALWIQWNPPLLTIRTQVTENQTVRLPDGSRVKLHPNSQLRYANQWTDENPKAVWLTGEADFEIARCAFKAPDQQFRVHLSTLTLSSCSTTFRVSDCNSDTRVTLVTGQLDAFLPTKKESFSLKPGETIVVNDGKVTITRSGLAVAKLD
ncbi:FecR family protein [Arsenicibacter rosenii]|uniref:FecR protein domain-containing protein n=1 Tax=Arsenicibacter rosenii TaxID=1750698 RepID=A0A1S2VJU3_9BACT|nr:FecR family protein [Arsenicibacter rosenii]OIN59003.1 hypothetical protein BLX24_12370 [Arsenicibacter rosenii]